MSLTFIENKMDLIHMVQLSINPEAVCLQWPIVFWGMRKDFRVSGSRPIHDERSQTLCSAVVRRTAGTRQYVDNVNATAEFEFPPCCTQEFCFTWKTSVKETQAVCAGGSSYVGGVGAFSMSGPGARCLLIRPWLSFVTKRNCCSWNKTTAERRPSRPDDESQILLNKLNMIKESFYWRKWPAA